MAAGRVFDQASDQASDGLLTLDVDRAVAVLRAGGLVAIPTETVYGLAADAEQRAAVERIFAAKGRPVDHPLIVHLAGIEHADGWIASDQPQVRLRMELLASACWPGPLTMLVPRGPRVIDQVTGGRPTVGLRVPSHPMTLAVLEQFGGGVAAPSANRFGKVSPTTAAHVAADLAGLLDPATDAILDGGPCPVGVESTIVDLTTSPPQVLRTGAIEATDIERLLATRVTGASGPSRASGMLAAHYAPNCAVVLADDARGASIEAARWREGGAAVRVLDRTADLVEAARELYTDLRQADADGLDALVVVLPPAVGLGHALRDRLLKAAAGTRPAPPSSTG
jgi:L-threonylcarbamoyladenylate synthase